MNTKNKVALCNNLNMNFDEASELFSEESLQSMQMAQINGGIIWPPFIRKLIEFAASVAVAISGDAIMNAWNSMFGKTSPTPSDQLQVSYYGVSAYGIEISFSDGKIKVDSLKIYGSESKPVEGGTLSPTNKSSF